MEKQGTGSHRFQELPTAYFAGAGDLRTSMERPLSLLYNFCVERIEESEIAVEDILPIVDGARSPADNECFSQQTS